MTVRDLGDDDYDVVVVGGGPAGLAAGVRCANEGVKTLLVERDPILTAKKSWSLGSKKGIKMVKEWGVDIEEITENRINKGFLSVSDPYTTKETVRMDDYFSTGDNIAHFVWQDRLTKMVLGLTDKLEVKDKNSVVDAKRKDKEVEIKTSDGKIYHSKILIDASGTTREPSRILGRNFNTNIMWTGYGYVLQGENISEKFGVDPNSFYADFGPRAKGAEVWLNWIYAAGEDILDFGMYSNTILSKRNPFPGREPPIGLDVKNHAVYYLRDIINMIKSRYKEQLKDAKIVRDFYGICGETWETKPYDDNLLIVGDAAGHASEWFIEGCLQALVFGRDAGSAALDSLSAEDYSRKYLKKYYKSLLKDDLYNRGALGNLNSTVTGGFFPLSISIEAGNYAINHPENKILPEIAFELFTGANFTFRQYLEVFKAGVHIAPKVLKNLADKVIK